MPVAAWHLKTLKMQPVTACTMSSCVFHQATWQWQYQLPVAGVVEAVIDGVREGCRTFGVQAKLIGIMSRTFGEAACQQELEAF